jgi:hypothetical protein
MMRAKNSGRKPALRDGLRPESASTVKKIKRIKKTQHYKQEVFKQKNPTTLSLGYT